MKNLLKQLLILTIMLATVTMIPGEALARRYVFIRPVSGASATYTFVSSSASVFGTSGGTTGTLDTTGAELLVVCIWDLTAGGQNLSDNKSNTYTQLTVETNFGQSSVCFYDLTPTVGTGHTWTTTSRFVGVGVLAMSTTGTPAFDQESGHSQNASGNIQPGSLTPTVNDSLIVTAFGSFNGSAPSMPTGYTQVASNTTSTAEAGGMGYKIQTTASAENPTWNGSGSSLTVNLAIFKP